MSLEEGEEFRPPARHRLAQQLRVDACRAECRTTVRTNGGELENIFFGNLPISRLSL